MNKYTPSFRKPSGAVVPFNDKGTSLVGKPVSAVIADRQFKVMKLEDVIVEGKKTKQRVYAGTTFLNAVMPKLFAADANQELHAIPQLHASFDNLEDSVAVALAEHLSTELLNTGTMTDLQYFYKLIDSHTLETISTDMPDREQAEQMDVPDFLKPAVTAKRPSTYSPNPAVCAFLHIYVEQNGVPVRIASSDIEARFAPEVDVVRKLVTAGTHIQAGVVPQTKVLPWLNSQEEADKIETTLNMSTFSQQQ